MSILVCYFESSSIICLSVLMSWISSYNPILLNFLYGVDTGVWTNVTPTTNVPSARFSVAGDCLDPLKDGVLVFIGGCNKSLEALDDMYYLYTGSVRFNIFASIKA